MAKDGDLNIDGIKALLQPRSVAVLGASDDVGKIGGKPVQYLREYGYEGRIIPINSRREVVQGLPAYPTIAAAPGEVDLAVIALPAALVVQAVRECADKNVKAVVLFSSGFAEIGEAGRLVQDKLAAIAQSTGMRILGPNCLGAINLRQRMFATFTGSVLGGRPEPGRIGFVSQSGALGSHCFTAFRARGLGFSYWVTTGNECDIEFADCLAYLAQDPDTDVIAAYIEGCRDGAKLQAALALARENRKPVVLLKVGESEVGAEAAASHTASLAGADAVYDAVFRQYGVIRARSLSEFVDFTYACTAGLFPVDQRIGLATISGGVGILMADKAAEVGLDVAPMPESAQAKLKQRWEPAAVRNPVDVTAQVVADITLLGDFLACMLEEGGYSVVLLFLAFGGDPQAFADKVEGELAPLRARYPERVFMLASLWTPEVRRQFDNAGFLTFEDPSMAVQAAAELMRLGREFAAPSATAHAEAVLEPSAAVELPRELVNEHAAKRLLAAAGVPVVEEQVVTSAQAAASAAEAYGGAVVLKIVSPDILHKTEVGGVLLNVVGGEAAAAGYAQLLAQVGARAPQARIEGVLVSRMVQGGVETLIGVQRDPVFGPVVAFGLGGIFVEILQDVALRVAPFGLAEAHAMIRQIKGYPLLAGARGQAAADVEALAQALVRVSQLAWANRERLETLDINPFLVLPEGQGAVAVDALIVPQDNLTEPADVVDAT